MTLTKEFLEILITIAQFIICFIVCELVGLLFLVFLLMILSIFGITLI